MSREPNFALAIFDVGKLHGLSQHVRKPPDCESDWNVRKTHQRVKNRVSKPKTENSQMSIPQDLGDEVENTKQKSRKLIGDRFAKESSVPRWLFRKRRGEWIASGIRLFLSGKLEGSLKHIKGAVPESRSEGENPKFGLTKRKTEKSHINDQSRQMAGFTLPAHRRQPHRESCRLQRAASDQRASAHHRRYP